MLSAESAMGEFPVESVAMLARIAATVETIRRKISVKEMYAGIDLTGKLLPLHLIAVSVEASLEYLNPAAVFARTDSGISVRRLAAFRLPVWTVAVTPNAKTAQDLLFSAGVVPVHVPQPPASWNGYVKDWVRNHELPGSFAILTQRTVGERPREQPPDGDGQPVNRVRVQASDKSMRVLVIDIIGGNSVKALATGETEPRKFASGPTLTPRQLVSAVSKLTEDWKYDAVSIGYPGRVRDNRPGSEPVNLGHGWVHFDFAKAFARPVRVINDAAMRPSAATGTGRCCSLGLELDLGRRWSWTATSCPWSSGTFRTKAGPTKRISG